MFSERNFSQPGSKIGWIEVITGCMFSGKTEELIRRLNRALIAQQKVEIFKPAIDRRYKEEDIVSHNRKVIRSTPVKSSSDILSLSGESDVIGIDEAQFFDDEIVKVCVSLANKGKRVILAGLDMDYNGVPFASMPQLMAIAEYVTKVHAICMKCGNLATHSFRLVPEKDKVLIGDKKKYEARCRRCFNERRYVG